MTIIQFKESLSVPILPTSTQYYKSKSFLYYRLQKTIIEKQVVTRPNACRLRCYYSGKAGLQTSWTQFHLFLRSQHPLLEAATACSNKTANEINKTDVWKTTYGSARWRLLRCGAQPGLACKQKMKTEKRSWYGTYKKQTDFWPFNTQHKVHQLQLPIVMCWHAWI